MSPSQDTNWDVVSMKARECKPDALVVPLNIVQMMLKSKIKEALTLQKEEMVKVAEGMKRSVVENDQTYPDARWQKENYGDKQFNLALSDFITKITKK